MENKNISLEAIRTIIKEEIRPEIERLDNKITDFKDDILTGQDKMNKKLDKILSEHPAMNGAIDENREEIAGHEKRIKKLEARQVPA